METSSRRSSVTTTQVCTFLEYMYQIACSRNRAGWSQYATLTNVLSCRVWGCLDIDLPALIDNNRYIYTYMCDSPRISFEMASPICGLSSSVSMGSICSQRQVYLFLHFLSAPGPHTPRADVGNCLEKHNLQLRMNDMYIQM